MANYTPYEMHILLEIHAGMQQVTANPFLELFRSTMHQLMKTGLVVYRGPGPQNYGAGPALAGVMAVVLNAPRPTGKVRTPLTERQGEILAFIGKNMIDKRMAPTRADICKHFGFKSPTAAEDHLRALEHKGYIKTRPGKARGIEILP